VVNFHHYIAGLDVQIRIVYPYTKDIINKNVII